MNSGITFLKDADWSAIDGEACRVLAFTPMASVQNGRVVASDKSVPYATVTLKCKNVPGAVKGFITNREDFIHLWAAFKERTLHDAEEVLIIWSKKHLKPYARLLSVFMPKLWVMICQKGAFEIMTDPSWKPEVTGEARWNAMKPIVEWKSTAME